MHEIAIAEKNCKHIDVLLTASVSVIPGKLQSCWFLNLLIFIGIPRITQVVMFTSFLKTAYVQNFFLFSYTQRVSNYSIGCVVCL